MRSEKAADLGGMTLDQFIRFSGGSSAMSGRQRRRRVMGVWNDSRNVGAGDVFVAITTENDDGHSYVKSAFANGAVAALVDRKKLSMFSADERTNLIAVQDPLKSLQKIAAQYRTTLQCPFVGITGSSGKTSARTFVAAVLARSMVVGQTRGNWNNHIGVPLSLLRFTGSEQAGVLEMGANHEREIHVLSGIVRPDIGIITNIGYAHIGYFGSKENILKAKFEIVDGMTKDGTLVLNGDDPLLVRRAKSLRQRVVFFGTSRRCQVLGENIRLASNGRMKFTVGNEPYEIPMPGRHFVYNALIALAIAREFGIVKKDIDAAFASLEPVAMRGAVRKKKGVTFIVDCYNANPSSMESGISLLSDVARAQRKIAIVGDMLELGRFSSRLHKALGRRLASAGIDKIIAVGNFANHVAQGATAAGMAARNMETAPTSAEAVSRARELVRRGDTVLLKGSRGIHLETVLEGF